SNTSFSLITDILESDDHESPNEGIYRIFASGVLGKKQVGVGIWKQGVFHTMWHVTRGSVLSINGRRFQPEWASVRDDLISYNGPWRLPAKWEGGEVQLHGYTPDGKVQVTQLLPGRMVTDGGEELGLIPIDHPPGTSGSPIITKDGHVVGLYGNGVVHGETYCSSIAQANVPAETEPEVLKTNWTSKGKLTVIDAHPGSGKTKKILPRLVDEAVGRKLRTLVLAPTRVVVKEMEQALRGKPVSFHSSAASKKVPGALVDVMCHATYVQRRMMPIPQKNYELVIMDEAHWTDPSSIAARGFLDSQRKENHLSLVLMTATPPGTDDPWPQSNAPINDNEKIIPEGDWKTGHDWITEFEGKTVWFVPSLKAGATIAKTLRGFGKSTAVLSSKTFSEVYPTLRDSKPDFILTTDISEMGANFDVDRVIDSRTTLKPIEVGNCVDISGERAVTPASAAQRRGRVGREEGRQAEYVYQGEVDPDDGDLVCWKEAQILLDNMEGRFKTASVFYEPEITKMPDTPGYFKLPVEKKKYFRHLISNCDFTPWLAWKVASETKGVEDRGWVSLGPKEHEIADHEGELIKFKSPSGRENILRPVWLDNRMIREKRDLEALIDYAKGKR
nr:non-structural protein NS3 [Apoi virus]